MKSLISLKITFALLYFVQGGAISFFSLFHKPYLSQLGLPTEKIALLAGLLLAPFVLKIGFGFLSDRFPYGRFGKRKPLMIMGLLLSSLSFFGSSLLSPQSQFLLYSLLIITASFSVAFFDAATDGLAIDQIPSDQQGPVQSFMVGGKALGVILLSLFIGNLIEWFGHSFVFTALSLVFLIPLLLTIFIEEPKSPIVGLKQDGKTKWTEIPLIPLAFFAVTYSFSSFGGDGLITFFLSKTYQISETQIGNYGALRGTGAIFGSLFCGWVLTKVSPWKINIFSLLLLGFGLFLIGSLMDAENFLFFGVGWGFTWGFQEVCFLSLCMRKLAGTSSAFAFSGLMALGNLGTALSEGLITRLTLEFSFSQIFSFLALFLLIPLVFSFMIEKKKKREIL